MQKEFRDGRIQVGWIHQESLSTAEVLNLIPHIGITLVSIYLGSDLIGLRCKLGTENFLIPQVILLSSQSWEPLLPIEGNVEVPLPVNWDG